MSVVQSVVADVTKLHCASDDEVAMALGVSRANCKGMETERSDYSYEKGAWWVKSVMCRRRQRWRTATIPSRDAIYAAASAHWRLAETA